MSDETVVASPPTLAARVSRRLAELNCEPELLGSDEALPLRYEIVIGLQRLVIEVNAISTLRTSVLESDERLWSTLAVWVVGHRDDVGVYLQPTGCYLSQVLDARRVLGVVRILESSGYTTDSLQVRALLV